MTDEPTPEVRALAAKLFAAGRAERPGPALGRRLLLIERQAAADGAPSPHEGDTSRGVNDRLRAPSRVAFWLAVAAMIAGGAGLSFVLEHDPGVVSISPERDPDRTRSNAAAHAAPVATAPAPPTASAARGTNVADGPSGGDDAEHVAPRSGTTAQPRARVQRNAVDSARPPSITPSDVRSPSARVAPNGAAASIPEAADTPARALPMTLLVELDLLKRARTALRSGDAQQALDLLTQREGEHTGNELDAEATLLRIETLAALGKPGEASELATRFVRANPNSALSDRAKTFIGATAPRP